MSHISVDMINVSHTHFVIKVEIARVPRAGVLPRRFLINILYVSLGM